MFKNSFFLGLLSSLLLFSCFDNTVENPPMVSLGAVPNLTSPATGAAFVLDENTLDNQVTEFIWTAADFGFQAGITYTIEMDAAGNNFADANILGSVNALSYSDLTIGTLNNILLAKGLPFGFANELEVRICASVSDKVDRSCSQPIVIKVTPFQAAVVYPKLTVPGDYQGWDPADESTAVFSRRSDEIYEGYLYFPTDTANFKFAQGLSWDTNWGDNEPDGTLDAGGVDNNIATGEGPGMYLVSANLNDLSHTNKRTNWGIIGSATPGGASTDTDLTWDETRSVLSITTDLSAGNLKFRANDGDDLNFGDDFANGTLEYSGEAIVIPEAGNYTIDLILTVSDYTYTLTKN